MYYVYMLSNGDNKMLYSGLTNDLRRALYEHKHSGDDTYTVKNQITRLVYFEPAADIMEAMERQSKLRSATLRENSELIAEVNPGWRDLSLDWRY